MHKYVTSPPTLGSGAAYKVLQRAYKFGGQPFVRDIITRHYGQVGPPPHPTRLPTHKKKTIGHLAHPPFYTPNPTHAQEFETAFGKRNGKTMIYAVAGSIMGVGEIVLLPLDVLKIKAQTNPETLQGRGVFRILADEGLNLYR